MRMIRYSENSYASENAFLAAEKTVAHICGSYQEQVIVKETKNIWRKDKVNK